MKRLVERIEKILMRTIILGIILLVVVQGLMTNDPVRFYLSWAERMEGQTLELPAAGQQQIPEEDLTKAESPQAVMILSVSQFSSLPKAKVLINGEEKLVFNDREIEVACQGGDIIEIDCTEYDFPLEFTVKEASENLSYPPPGKIFTANNSIVLIGKIIVK